MKTAIETAKDGTKLRVYHRAGTYTVDGEKFEGRYSWTHPLSERKTCDACRKGTIPSDVKDGTKASG